MALSWAGRLRSYEKDMPGRERDEHIWNGRRGPGEVGHIDASLNPAFQEDNREMIYRLVTEKVRLGLFYGGQGEMDVNVSWEPGQFIESFTEAQPTPSLSAF